MFPSRHLGPRHRPCDLLIAQPSQPHDEEGPSMRARVYVGLCTAAVCAAGLLWAGGAPRLRYR